MPYGDEWRLHRKLFHSVLNKEQSRKYAPVQLHRVHKFLVHLLATPQDFKGHFETLASAIIMDIGYGYTVAPRNDPLVAKAIRLLNLVVEVVTPERTAFLSTFPFLAHIPSWMPGGVWKRRAKECRQLIRNILDDPVQYVRDRITAGTAKTSMVQDMYEMGEDSFDAAFDKEAIIKDVAGTLFLTSLFLLAMVLYPDVQKKAQEEIDRVVGTDRLPDFDDRPNLPYIEAVTLETLRWLPVVPLGIPHMTTTDDVYKGMHIPRGATIVPNVWAMTRDPERFPEPDTFNPNRHLPTGLWATIVSMLATLQIGKLKDASGNDIEFHPEFKTGVGLCPKPFPCSIKARSVEAEQLIRAAVDWNDDTSDLKTE
ncbi:cytochrome P450 [Pisolithus sp. B1]|nr:cytochrome P450 [Pisolithus sp. B1]